MLTVEWGTQGVHMKRGFFLVGALGLSCWYKRLLFCLGCSSRLSTKKKFHSQYTISLHMSPSSSKLGM
jgi:hypothetical protein